MTTLTVATLNLRHRADRWRQRRHLVVAELVDCAPDLLSLQELSMPIGQGRWLRHQINVRLSGSTRRPYRLLQARKRHLWHGYFEGIGILTRLPVLSHDLVSLGHQGRLALRANVELPTGASLDFVSVHLHHVSQERQARLEQVMGLLGWLDSSHPVAYQVVAGDFNESPDGPAIMHMKQRFRSAYEEVVGREPLATFPTALARQEVPWAGCLDYIFLSPAMPPVKMARLFCRTPAAGDQSLYPSDHVGLVAKVEFEA